MKKAILVLALVGVLLVPAAAFAGGIGYSNVGGVIQSATTPSPPTTTTTTTTTTTPAATVSAASTTSPSSSSGSLPFTGLDVGLVAAGGLVLVATGLALRRLGKARSAS